MRLEDLDQYLRKTIRTSNTMYPYLLPAVAAVATIGGAVSIYYNWEDHRRDLASEAAEVAQDLLADDQLQRQLDEIAKMLLSGLLNDPATVLKVTMFVQQILANPSINDSVLAIVLRIIHDERTVSQVVDLLQRVLAQDATKDALIVLLSSAMQDDLGKDAAIEYVRAVVTAEETQALLAELASAQISEVLTSEDTKQLARTFVQTVLQDDALQARSADAVWKIIRNAFWPTGSSTAKKVQQAQEETEQSKWSMSLDTGDTAETT